MRLLDQHGYDLLEGLGADRDALNVEQTAIRYASTSLNPVVHESDALTLVIDNHVAASAQLAIELTYALGA